MNDFISLKLGVRIPAGTTPAGTKTQVANWFTDAGWQVLPSSTDVILDVMPPASEEVGNSLGADVLRIRFGASDIGLWHAQLLRVPTRGKYSIGSSSNGSTATLKIGEQSFSITGATGGGDGIISKMYQTLTSSTAPEAQAYTYELISVTGSDNDRIIATEKDAGQGKPIVGVSYVFAYTVALPSVANTVVDRSYTPGKMASTPFVFPVNYGLDWALFASFTTRSVIFGIRTSANGFQGPFVASWMNQADAVGQCPSGCIPVQLGLMFTDARGASGSARITMKYGHAYGYGGTSSISSQYPPTVVYDISSGTTPLLSSWGIRNLAYMYGAWNTYACPMGIDISRDNIPALLGGASTSVLAEGISFGTTYTSVSMPMYSTWVPSAVWPDALTFLADGDNETSIATRTSSVKGVLAQNIDSTVTNITLVDASMMAPKGTVIIGSEIINYASKDGNTLQGCERGRAATQPSPHTTAEDVFRGFWWIRINSGAIPAGPVDPATLTS